MISLKRIFTVILLIYMIFSAMPGYAEGSFIRLEPLCYSSYVLGEDIIVKGETDFDYVTVGLYYPDEYSGFAKYIITISASEFSKGCKISTDEASKQWPEGNWRIMVQNGNVKSDVYVPLLSEPVYDKYLRIAKYDGDTLTEVKTYKTRGALFKDDTISFALSDETFLKLFFWNDNLAPSSSGNGSIYLAQYSDGNFLSAQKFSGELSQKLPITVTNNSETYKIFCWNENLQG
jgi:hypothetical protein